MKRSKFTEEQIAFVLHQADTGTAVEEVSLPAARFFLPFSGYLVG
jgi:hypothetical protein